MTIFKAKERQIIRMAFTHADITDISGEIKIGSWSHKWRITCHRPVLWGDETYYSGDISGSYGEDITGDTLDEVLTKMDAVVDAMQRSVRRVVV